MFVSKFLLNRQKIFNTWDIHKAIESYFPSNKMVAGRDYLYRLEWYKIGISVPVLVYSKQRPEMQICKEFQLFESEECPTLLPTNTTECKFSIFLVPDFVTEFCPDKDFIMILNWFKKKLQGAAKVLTCKSGPNNCIYYDLENKSYSQQTITLNGTLQIKNRKKLQKLLETAIGQKPELGCGLLLLK